MELESRHVFFGVAAALAVGAGYAWYIAQPAKPAHEAAPAPSFASDSASNGPAPTLYKWRDNKGVWNYTDKPPSDRAYTAITGTPNVNSVPTVVPETAIDSTGAEENAPAR